MAQLHRPHPCHVSSLTTLSEPSYDISVQFDMCQACFTSSVLSAVTFTFVVHHVMLYVFRMYNSIDSNPAPC